MNVKASLFVRVAVLLAVVLAAQSISASQGMSAPVNTSPIVQAGADQAVSLPAAAALHGSVSDDNLPDPPAAVTVTWSKLSGPGAVTFADINALDTAATFTTEGTYVLRLTAGDSALFAVDELVVTVFPAAVHYSILDLGTLGGDGSSANGINNSGQVVGESYTADGSSHAYRTAANQPINPATDDLGTLDGRADGASEALGINDLGQVVGWSSILLADQTLWEHAFRTAANQPINPATDDLGTLGGLASYAYGINDSGQVVGEAHDPNNSSRAFRTAANQPINPATDDLGTLGGGNARAYGINNSGQAVGEATDSSGYDGAFRTAANQPINPAADNLRPKGTGAAVGINNLGQAVGYAYLAGDHAFRTAPNLPIDPNTDDLGTMGHLESYATAINEAGQVVGWWYDPGNVWQDHAFLWTHGVMYDLNDLIPAQSGWQLWEARGINDAGQIVGNGKINGLQHAFLLTPMNLAPAVNAGVDQTIALPAAALTGKVSDDGMPNPPATTTLTWTVMSGPGAVTFADAGAADTTATFSTEGAYVLRLTAGDSALSANDEVTITVQNVLPAADFNGDGKVNGQDFLIWQSHYPTASGAAKADGDANGDGKVNGQDFLLWQSGYRPMP